MPATAVMLSSARMAPTGDLSPPLLLKAAYTVLLQWAQGLQEAVSGVTPCDNPELRESLLDYISS